MATRARKAESPRAGDKYLDLIRRHPLRPIRSDAELADATAVVEGLVSRDDLAPEELDYLDVLASLVEAYEDEHHPIPPASDAEMLRYLIEARGVTQAKVAEATGIAAPTISDILAGRRALNRRHIGALARFFKIDPSVFISAD